MVVRDDLNDDLDVDEPAARPVGWSRRTLVVLGVIGAVVLLGLGFLAGHWGPILTAPANDSAEAGFARDMITHH